jgi:hypothetical protein
MAGGHEKAGNLRPQEPGREDRHCSATNDNTVAKYTLVINDKEPTRRTRNGGSGVTFRAEPTIGEPFMVEVWGRLAWASDRLPEAGARGCTPIAEPGPRWSAYVHDLRQLGVEIETIRESHGEPYPGHHGRYVLRSTVRRAAR